MCTSKHTCIETGLDNPKTEESYNYCIAGFVEDIKIRSKRKLFHYQFISQIKIPCHDLHTQSQSID